MSTKTTQPRIAGPDPVLHPLLYAMMEADRALYAANGWINPADEIAWTQRPDGTPEWEARYAEYRAQQRAANERRAEQRAHDREAMERLGLVYFLRRADGLIKIGASNQFSKRLHALEKEHGRLAVLATMQGYLLAEQAEHRRFAADRDHREWFRPSPALLARIAQLRTSAQA